MIFKCGNDQRCYSELQHDEVAAIFIGDEGAPRFKRDIIVALVIIIANVTRFAKRGLIGTSTISNLIFMAIRQIQQ